MSTTRPNQSGLTLVEIMIAMAVGSLLLGMIFAIYTKMSVAYRSQSRVTEVNQTVRAAAAMIARDVSMAGYGIPNANQPTDENTTVSPHNGIFIRGGGSGPCSSSDLPTHICPDRIKPLYVINANQFGGESASAGDPDQIFMYGADARTESAVESFETGSPERVELETPSDVDKFTVGDLVVVVVRATADVTNGADGGPPNTVILSSCLGEVTSKSGDALRMESGPSFNSSSLAHCDSVRLALNSTALSGNYQAFDAYVYRLWARAYRIDPASGRNAFGVLQVSETGGIQNDWEDLALGVTNLQIATQYWEPGDVTDRDGDGDPELDWYSGDNMAHPPVDRPNNAVIRTVSISVEGRTTSETDSVGTTQTPAFGSGNYDQTGDFSTGYDLSTGTQPNRYQGNHVYRWATTRVDIRNQAVGQ